VAIGAEDVGASRVEPIQHLWRGMPEEVSGADADQRDVRSMRRDEAGRGRRAAAMVSHL
jgi:hypothetical protein